MDNIKILNNPLMQNSLKGQGIEAKLFKLATIYLLVIFLITILTFFYSHIFHNIARTADTSSSLLAAQDILSGNYLLKDWVFPSDNYYTTDFLPYIIAEKFYGVDPDLMYILPAFCYAIAIIFFLFIILKCSNADKKYLSLLIGIFWLSFPTRGFPIIILSYNPNHVFTVIYMFLAFWFLKDIQKSFLCLIAFVLLFLSDFGDSGFASYLGNFPLLIAALIIPSLTKKTRFMWAGIAVFSLILTILVKKIIAPFSFQSVGIESNFNSLQNLWNSALINIETILNSFNANFFSQQVNSLETFQKIFRFLLLSSGIFFFINFVKKIKNNKLENTAIQRFLILLATCILVNMIICVFSDRMTGGVTIRYLYPAIFGFIILSALGIPSLVNNKYHQYSLSVVITFFLVLSGIQFINDSKIFWEPEYWPGIQSKRFDKVEKFLISKNLLNGYGSFWLTVITGDTKDKVKIRQVDSEVFNKIGPWHLVAKKEWYKEGGNFLMWNEGEQFGNVNSKTALHTFGQPAKKYFIDGVHIWVWEKPLIFPKVLQWE